ncbi:hypothetical protein [Glycomyces buryatensis]|uniref:Uncharacterized protein n=1 Tax=Glycomyces buryatensis TaxID=2570927 RepID=A0A4S8Q1K2_9ACTN|nr:hypothetical protein [Glycomyces buryatensis]THV36971.1 hypothetical protein FAB82_20635 [Glycomyces buryatensis]
MWVLIIIVAVGAAGWFAVSCQAGKENAERPVTEEEAQLLAGVRGRNHEADPVAVRMRFPVEGDEITVDAYLDWQTPMLYARFPTSDGGHELIQAVPGLVATHADDEESFGDVTAPENGWTSRQMLSGASDQMESMLDIMVSSVFTLTSEKGDDADYMAEHATWREEGIIDGADVATFRAPIMVDSDEQTGTSPEGLYSIDGEGDIRRFQVNTGGAELAAVDFLREVDFDATALHPVDLLGGPKIEPTEVDEDMAETIAGLRQENWLSSAKVDMTVPTGDDKVVNGHGYVDWRTMTAYLNITDAEGSRLFLARPGGVASLETDSDELPETLPEDGWEMHALTDEDVADSFGPVESMAYRLLEMAAESADDAGTIAEQASQLRVDEAEGEKTFVVEYPVAGDAEAAAGESAFRYYVAEGRLSQVEMMTYYGVASAELAYEDYPMTTIPWEVSERIG